MRKRIRLCAGMFVAVAVATGSVGASAADSGATFDDWRPGASVPGSVGPLPAPVPVGQTIEPVPNRRDGEVTTNGPVSFVRLPQPSAGSIDASALASGTTATPTAVQTGDTARPSTATQWCYYWWNNWDAVPPPPGQGNSYAIARATRNGVSWTQAFESHGGGNSTTDSSSSYTSHNLPIVLPDYWPQPSRLIGVVNPQFKGQHFLDSNNSIFGSQSFASSRERIRFGWLLNGVHYWDTLWNFYHESHNGLDYSYTHEWPGHSDSGEFAYAEGIPTRSYTFKFRVDATAKTSTVFGAGARSQIDWGSQGIDAPSLGPGNHVHADHRVAWALIGYEVPDGWNIQC